MKSKAVCVALAILLFAVSISAASSVTYSTTTNLINVKNDRGVIASVIPVSGLTDVIVYQGTYLYASTTSDIRKFDIGGSKAYNPTRLTPWISTPANSLAIKGTYLYAGGKDLRVYSLANPKSPRLVNIKPLKSPCKVNGLEIYQDVLYVTTTSNGVQTFPII